MAASLLLQAGDDKAEERMKEEVRKSLDTGPEETVHVVNCLKKCAEKRHLLNVLDLYKTGNSPQRQEHFLFALLKPVADNAADLESQLSLALACNFLPLARCCLQAGGYGTDQSQDPRYTPMLSALIHNRADFVELFLESQLDLSKFLTTNTLRVLFDPWRAKAQGDIGELLRYMLKNFRCPNRRTDDLLLWRIDALMDNRFRGSDFSFYKRYFESETRSPKIAARLLFLWAMLFLREELAFVFWKEGANHTAMALCASQLLESLSQRADNYHLFQLAEELQHHSRRWEEMAKELSVECCSADLYKTHALLRADLPCCKCEDNVLDMAMRFEKQEFAADSALQTTVALLWKPPEVSAFKAVLGAALLAMFTFSGILVVLLIPSSWVLRVAGLQRQPKLLLLVYYGMTAGWFLVDMTFLMVSLFVLKKLKKTSILSVMESGMFKLCWRQMNHFLVMLTASCMLMTERTDKIAAVMVVYGVMQAAMFLVMSSGGWMMKSPYEVATVFCFFICVVVTIQSQYYATMLATAGIIFGWMNLLHLFFIDKFLGPMVVIMERMILDIIRLLPMGALLVLGFGVAYHSLMYPNTPHGSLDSILSSCFVPYFQMFGEFDMKYFQGLFVDEANRVDIDGRHKDRAVWEAQGKDPRTKYPDNNPLLPWILGMYMVMANVMYLTIVISQLNCRFQVRENVRVIARYQWARAALFHCNLGPSRKFPLDKEELDEFEGEALERYLTRSQDTLNN